MGIFEKLLRGMAGSHHGGYRGGHHGGRHGYPSNTGQPYEGAPAGGPPCPKCGIVVGSGARYCPQCGTSLVPGTCAACNATLTVGAKFCPNCGKASSS